jgi:transcription factor SPN1
MAQAKARTSRRRSPSSRSKTTSRNGTSSTRTKAGSARKTSNSRKSGSSSRSSSGTRSSSSRGRSTSKASQARARSGSSSRNGKSTVETVGGSVKETAATGANTVGSAAQSVGQVVKKAKTPLLAGGAALVGLAGAVAARSLERNHRGGALSSLRDSLPGKSSSNGLNLSLPKRRKGVKGGVRKLTKNVNEAAKQADSIGQRVSNVANVVQRVSETADKAAKKA